MNDHSMTSATEPLHNQVYIDTGKGRPVILLHGLFGNLVMWRSLINKLQETHRVIVPRLPLFEAPVHRATLGNLLEALHLFLDWHQLTDVTLVGTDIGGQLALCYANRFSNRVRNIILSGSSGYFENLPLTDREYDKDFAAIDSRVKDAFFKRELATPSVVKKIHATVNMSSNELYIQSLSKSSRETDLSQFLHRLNLPVLLIWGLEDKITPPEVALQFHDRLRAGTLKFVHECGHLPMIEKPEIYLQHVLYFLTHH
jgi:2-hydroxy-6-oxonona-2,4-dienedioate hydrolase